MEIKSGNRFINKKTKKSIVDIQCNEHYKIYVFQGGLSENDIIIKYCKDREHIRTPKHIHWVVDILMKMQGQKKLTRKFLLIIQDIWKESEALKNNDIENISTVIKNGFEEEHINSFESLNKYGEYEIDFLFTLVKLLIVQEKTNRSDAHMFGKIIEKLLEDKIDIFSIMSTAGFNGRK